VAIFHSKIPAVVDREMMQRPVLHVVRVRPEVGLGESLLAPMPSCYYCAWEKLVDRVLTGTELDW
jgi:hypothetical protein